MFPQKTAEKDLLLAQLTINGQQHAPNAVDDLEAFARLIQLNAWSPSQLAEALAISNAAVTRTLAIGKLTPDERRLVVEGKISKSSTERLISMRDSPITSAPPS